MNRVVFPEYAIDDRVQKAADIVRSDSIATVVAMPEEPSSEAVEHVNGLPRFADRSSEEIRELLQDPIYRAVALLAMGEADIVIAGATRETADVLRAGYQLVGLREGNRTMSSFFKMTTADGGVNFYADCGVIPNPTPEQRADIAVSTAQSAKNLGFEPRVAILSYTTHTDADLSKHPDVSSVKDTVRILEERGVDFVFDGDVQFDVATNPETARKKSPDSPFADAPANVFIFPDLEAGNISYKVAQSFGAQAEGPLIQGLAKPVHDLSRGCKVDDIVKMTQTAIELL